MRRTLDLSRGQDYVPKSLQTPAELSRLALLAQAGDKDAEEDLYWRMRPLVYFMAVKFGYGKNFNEDAESHGRTPHWLQEEILQEAWVALASTVERWDPEHPAGKSFWTVASYRIDGAIKMLLAKNAGGMPMGKNAYERAPHIDAALERAGMEDWEEYTDAELHKATGVRSAGAILRARRHKFTGQEDEYDAYASAEDVYWHTETEQAWAELVAWLRGLDAIPEDHWEEATYWKLEQLGMAGGIEASDLVAKRHLLEDDA